MARRVENHFLERERVSEEDRLRFRALRIQSEIGEAGTSGTEFLNITEFDGTDPTHYYYGGLDFESNWKINRYLKTTLARTYADEIGNPAQTSLALAWANRLTLSYV
jgi:hypothetical protein